MRTKRAEGAALALVVTVGAAACEVPTLGTDSSLQIAFQSDPLYAGGDVSSAPADADACARARGAIVDVFGWDADGRAAAGALVLLWLDPSGGSRLTMFPSPAPSLFSLPRGCTGQSDSACAVLSSDGAAHGCFVAGNASPQVKLFARSGVVEASRSLSILDHTLVAGGALDVTVNPVTSGVALPAIIPRICGMPAPLPCYPGAARKAQVGVVASSPAGFPAPIDGTRITLSVTAGWLSPPGECLAAFEGGAPVRTFETVGGVVNADWCFGDVGAQAQLTVSSGSVWTTARTSVPAVPVALIATSSHASAPDGGTVTLNAAVLGCDLAGVAAVPVVFSVTRGGAQLWGPNVVSTNQEGVASIQATVQPPVTVHASMLKAPEIECSANVEVQP